MRKKFFPNFLKDKNIILQAIIILLLLLLVIYDSIFIKVVIGLHKPIDIKDVCLFLSFLFLINLIAKIIDCKINFLSFLYYIITIIIFFILFMVKMNIYMLPIENLKDCIYISEKIKIQIEYSLEIKEKYCEKISEILLYKINDGRNKIIIISPISTLENLNLEDIVNELNNKISLTLLAEEKLSQSKFIIFFKEIRNLLALAIAINSLKLFIEGKYYLYLTFLQMSDMKGLVILANELLVIYFKNVNTKEKVPFHSCGPNILKIVKEVFIKIIKTIEDTFF